MEWLYLIAAAAFGYVATIVHKRYEVNRGMAQDIDSELQRALDISLLDTCDTDRKLLNELIDVLRRTEHRTVGLPARSAKRVHDQVHVATFLAYAFWEEGNRRPEGPYILQLAVHAAREVVGPLLRPAVIPRRAGKPRSFPSPQRFAEMLELAGFVDGVDAALEAADHSRQPGGGGPLEAFESGAWPPERFAEWVYWRTYETTGDDEQARRAREAALREAAQSDTGSS